MKLIGKRWEESTLAQAFMLLPGTIMQNGRQVVPASRSISGDYSSTAFSIRSRLRS